MAAWEYKVAYVDFRGRISSEGSEFIRQPGEHRTAFVRRYLDALGRQRAIGRCGPRWIRNLMPLAASLSSQLPAAARRSKLALPTSKGLINHFSLIAPLGP